MSTTIYYFSATGNTLFIARKLAGQLENTQLIPISSLIKEETITSSSDKVGFLFPVYFFGMPQVMYDVLRRFQQRPGQYCFGIAVNGRDGVVGNALIHLNKACRKENINLSYANELAVEGGWIVVYKPVRSEQFAYTDVMKNKVKQMAADINGCRKIIYNLQYRPMLAIIYKVLFPIFRKRIKGFKVKSSCIGCGRCAKLCPVGNIVMIDGKPVWKRPCEHCLSCLHWCPKGAIEYGKMTVGKNRYTNPEIHAEDLYGVVNKTMEEEAP